MLKLYDLAGADEGRRFSPHCWRVRMALAHKGLAVQTVPWRFTEKDRLPQPNAGMVPVLVDGDSVVHDSWKIAVYLETRYPERPLFGCAAAAAHALLIKYWVEKALHPLISRMVLVDIWSGLHDKDKAYFRDSREKRFGKRLEEVVADRDGARRLFRDALEPLRAMLADQLFVCGAEPGFADYLLLGTFQWARCGSGYALLDPADPVASYRERLLDLFDGLARRSPHLAAS
jgi:glutathione S-transferase